MYVCIHTKLRGFSPQANYTDWILSGKFVLSKIFLIEVFLPYEFGRTAVSMRDFNPSHFSCQFS
jgi:hypothetical protein